jgi:lycopene cyclase domain-containing protein
MKGLYFLIDACTLIVPLLFSFHPKIRFYSSWKSFFTGSMLVAIFFIGWDIAFTHAAVWRFNPRYVTGVYLVNLPIEEVLFFICIPFSCVFTYYSLEKFFDLSWTPRAEKQFCVLFSGALLILGSIFTDKAYTAITLLSTALVIVFLTFMVHVAWLGKAVSTYGILLVPFLLVNGILTGAGLQEPVVLYNNQENLGIRLWTIPIEDVLYGLELFLLNVFAYESIRKKYSTEPAILTTPHR